MASIMSTTSFQRCSIQLSSTTYCPAPRAVSLHHSSGSMVGSLQRSALARPVRAVVRPERQLVLRAMQRQSNKTFVRGRPEKFEPDVLLNDQIRCRDVRLLDEAREMVGVVSKDEAMRLAEESGVDLICINPDAEPPLCRLVEYSKYKYELEKAVKTQKKKQREGRVDIKELKLRPNTDVHDYQVRLRAAEKFIAKGNKVKLSLQFRGREMEFQELGRELFTRFMQDLGDAASIEAGPNMTNRTMSMVIAPAKAKL